MLLLLNFALPKCLALKSPSAFHMTIVVTNQITLAFDDGEPGKDLAPLYMGISLLGGGCASLWGCFCFFSFSWGVGVKGRSF